MFDTGTPVIVVIVSGRPYALGDVAGRAAALVQAFMPGEEGGPAIAGVLSGRISPGGKLPVQIPRHPGGQPRTYLQPPLGSAESAGISSVDPTPLFPFGFGRSYTSFEIDDLRFSSTEAPTDGEFAVSVRVRNTGTRPGREVVQVYASRPDSAVERPSRWLAGFAAATASPGQETTVEVAVPARSLAHWDGESHAWTLEEGIFHLAIGRSFGDQRLTTDITVTETTATHIRT